jgi:hypothetical protein
MENGRAGSSMSDTSSECSGKIPELEASHSAPTRRWLMGRWQKSDPEDELVGSANRTLRCQRERETDDFRVYQTTSQAYSFTFLPRTLQDCPRFADYVGSCKHWLSLVTGLHNIDEILMLEAHREALFCANEVIITERAWIHCSMSSHASPAP